MSSCSRRVTVPTNDPDQPLAVYCYQQGTSMAAAHVSGVAALVLSRWTNTAESGESRREQVDAVSSMLYGSAEPIACPTPDDLALYAGFPAVDNGARQECQPVGPKYNSWYGYGLVDAQAAVLAASGNSNRGH
jgi:subtilisin family serine protease